MRALLALVAVVALAAGWVGKARQQRELVAALRASNPAAIVELPSGYFASATAVELYYATDSELQLVGRLSRLSKLLLYRSVDITDEGLMHLRGLRELNKLVLTDATAVTDAGLAHVGAIVSLEELLLDAGPRVTATGILKLASLHRLRHLEIACYDDEARRAVDELRGLLPGCQIRALAGGEVL